MSKKLRAPIVTVLGHVDHGKTTLLDTLRDTSQVKREVGGITQGIGASEVSTKDGNKITFIDTPGHAAFSAMRESGAKVADIALLVIAADDGVKPQTKEALDYIQKAGISMIVVATKVDLPSADSKKAKSELAGIGVKFDDDGGDTPFVEVSSTKSTGIENLLEMIALVWEVSGKEADPEGELAAFVIETEKGRQGPQISVVVKSGSIKKGDTLYGQAISGKARGLFDWNGKPVNTVGPGEPVMIIGFSELPEIGSEIKGVEIVGTASINGKISSANVSSDKKNVVVKASSSGSLEAVLGGLTSDVNVVSSGVGDVTDNDVFLAKSANAIVVVFESKIPTGVKNLANTESVEYERFDIIYKLFERVEEYVKQGELDVVGEATILDTFPFNKKRVAGSRVSYGVIAKSNRTIIRRGEKDLGEVRITSLKREKKDINEAKAGEECGIVFEPQLAFEVGDVIISVRK